MTEGFGICDVPEYEEPQTAFNLYADFESFVNKEMYVDNVSYIYMDGQQLVCVDKQWCWNHFLLTRTKGHIDSIYMTKETSICYKQVSEQTLMNNLRDLNLCYKRQV